MITELKEDEIFVFGSNDNGSHGAGAANLAYEKFGALWGMGRGAQGQSYAIATLNESMQPHLLIEIREQIDQLYEVASNNRHKRFLMTWIGCGIAGFKKSEIAPLFKGNPNNVILPEDYEQIIQPETKLPKAEETQMDREQIKDHIRKIFGWPRYCRPGTEASLDKVVDFILELKEGK